LSDPQNERLKPRKTFGVMFDYNEGRGQFHGIMWHIATAKVNKTKRKSIIVLFTTWF
jgi:hypothetical protein